MPIDKGLFRKTERVDAARIPSRSVSLYLKHPRTSEFVWTLPGRKSVYPCPSDPKNYRIILLKSDIPDDLNHCDQLSRTTFDVEWTYEDASTDDALRTLLPYLTDRPTSFETIGHIAHMNLREEFLPHKEVIGQVILDKNPHIDTVVTKVGALSNEFRTFDMEIIACRNGNRSLISSVSENKMRLNINYEKCYWNSRLSSERSRLLKSFLSTDPSSSRLIDMCCGVGALACFTAREGLEVFANDLNPDAIACCRDNMSKNKVEFEAFNMDAREFVRKLVSDGKLSESKVNHVMINLPEIGIAFIDVFAGLFKSEEELGSNEFRIYCHCFSRENPPADVRSRVHEALRVSDEDGSLIPMNIVHVRDVAPCKIMYSVELTVPRTILVSSKRSRLP